MIPDKKLIDEICKKLSDNGRLIEAGWIGLKMLSIPHAAPQIQIDEMRNAFFAGAQHLWGSIMAVMEPGVEPTENDLRRLSLINDELQQFIAKYKEEHFT